MKNLIHWSKGALLGLYLKISFLLLSLFLLSSPLKAQLDAGVSAAPYPIAIQQSNGESLQIIGKGNSMLHYTETIDGYTILKNRNGIYEYAIYTKDGNLELSGQNAHDPNSRNASEKQFLTTLKTQLRHAPHQQRRIMEYKKAIFNEQRSMMPPFPTTGSQKVLMLLIEYPDLGNTNTRTEFDNFMNQFDFNGTGSFKDYYTDSSFGQLTLSTDVFGWYMATNDYLYYADDNGRDRARELGGEAVDAAEAAGVDFSQYDNDGNLFVDGIIFVHAGPGAEEGSQSHLYIWSHRSSLGAFSRNYDGVEINDYMFNPERRGGVGAGSSMIGIGVFCHEFGHGLGLPDLYDTDDSNGDSEGIGHWGLMGSGNWLGNTDDPGGFGAWSKIKLGWESATDITGDIGCFTLEPASTVNNEVYRLNTADPNEYFLLENRQQEGVDVAINGTGLIIWHIDDNQSNNKDENDKWVDVEEADGDNDLDNNTNRSDSGDLFPGSSNNTVFDDGSNPNALQKDGASAGVSVNGIREDGTTVYFNMGCDQPQAVCEAFVNLYLDATGNVSLTIGQVDNGSSAPCGGLSMSISKEDFNCSNLGFNSVTLTVEDQYCNFDECDINVYVKDEIDPILNVPPDITVPCSYSPTGPEATGFATATDNCDDSPTVTYDDFPVSGTAPDQIVFKRTWTAEDNEENTSEGDQFITIPPLLTTEAGPDQTVYVDFVGIPGYPYSACATLTASGNGGTPPYSYTWSTGEAGTSIEVCPDVCTIYEVTITDANGCVAMDEVTVFAIIVECMKGNNPNLKYLVCHKNKTICTSFSATEVHLSHGDGLGACGDLGDDGCAPLEELTGGESGLRPIFIAQSDQPPVQVFPNPSMDHAFFHLLATNDGLGTLSLYDLTSRTTIEVYKGQFQKGIIFEIEVSTKDFKPGIYMYKFQVRGKEPVTGKLVILR